jgi:hypothetical protein
MCDWNMVWTIIGVNLGIFGVILWIFNKLDSDIKSVGTKIDADMRAQSARTDKLYEMFIDLVKVKKERTEP